ncbi:MAG: XRE family transcriptional regulator [Thermoleophilia bacterium]|nr:XRE family transcriptional regulator [Thermoleophilia bacterium]
MPLAFRNVDVSPADPVTTWPYEALVTAMERGLVADWQPVIAEVRRRPWGPVARAVDDYCAAPAAEPDAAAFFRLVVARARSDAEAAERAQVAAKVTRAIRRSGMPRAEFARAVGTSASRLSTYATGAVTPSAAMLLRIEAAGRSASGS